MKTGKYERSICKTVDLRTDTHARIELILMWGDVHYVWLQAKAGSNGCDLTPTLKAKKIACGGGGRGG
jgi:hypothetical protein